MIQKAYGPQNPNNPWKTFFYNCRQALQSEAGLKVAEFIFPLLILDRICSNSKEEEQLICQEFTDVLDVGQKLGTMNHTNRQKAVSAVFSVIDTLTYWAESGREALHKSSKSRHARRRPTRGSTEVSLNEGWNSETAIAKIDEVLSMIPLEKQALGASLVGMHARALRLLEFADRKSTVQSTFEDAIDPHQDLSKHADNPKNNIELWKDLLAKLDDCESMVALGGDHLLVTPANRVRNGFRRKEAQNDYEGALKDYERALQLAGPNGPNLDLEVGALRCQLELGHFESVLKQAAGLTAFGSQKCAVDTKRFAVEAAWRLGRWKTLEELVNDEEDKGSHVVSSHTSGGYEVCIGQTVLGLQKGDPTMVSRAVQEARKVTLDSLSIVARENYSRSYPDIVRLHCLREMENAAVVLFREIDQMQVTLEEAAHPNSTEGWEWDSRMNLATSKGASSIISTRVVLARISGESELQGSLFLSIGKQARKQHLHGIAENYLSQAESVFLASGRLSTSASKLGNLLYSTRVQLAKLKHEQGESTLALRLLGQDSVQKIYDRMIPHKHNATMTRKMAVEYERERMLKSGLSFSADSDEALSDRFVSRLLKSTQWMVEGGLTSGSEVLGRFQMIHQLAPKWEKGE